VLPALGSCDPFEVILVLFHIRVDFLLIVELFQFLLLHLLLQELLLFGKSKLFVAAGEAIG